MNIAVDGENDDARPFAFDGFAQTSRPRIVEIGNDERIIVEKFVWEIALTLR